MANDKSGSKREHRILEAAAKLFAHYGYDKTTVSDIAKAAGISKGAVYLHYASKEELFDKLIIHEGMKMLDVVIERVEADPDAGSIFALYQHSIVATYTSPLVLALLRQDSKVLGEMARRMKDQQFGMDSDFIRHELVAQLQDANVIRRDLDAGMISHIMALVKCGFLMINEFVPAHTMPPLDAVGKTVGEVLERGLAPEGGGDKQAGKAVMEHFLHMTREMLKQHQEQTK